MLRLDTITRKLQVVLGALVTTNQLPVAVMYADKGAVTYAGAAALTNTNGITAVDIAAAPTSAVVRHIDYLSVRNSDTVAATVTIRYNDNATLYVLNTTTLGVGEELTYTHASGWRVIDAGGATKTSQVAATTTFTGDVTGVGTGSVALTIASGAVTTTKILDAAVTTAKLLDTAVTYPKLQNVTTTDRLLGRSTVGAGVVEEIPCTAAGRAVLAGVDAVAQRATLGLVIGTNVQAYDADLAAIAALAGTSGLARKTAADTWILETSNYLTAEADTLALVTGRGATTATAVSITNTTASTSAITGALIVSGGAGLGKDLNIAGATFGLGGGAVATNFAGGFQALLNNTLGDANFAGGYQALLSNTIGASNFAGGFRALMNNINGINNWAGGYQALGGNTSGNDNFAGGFQALLNNTSGSKNFGGGHQVLYSNATGTGLTAVGWQAGYSATVALIAGTNLTYLGYASTANASGYSNSTAVGAFAAITASNQVAIGDVNVTAIVPGGNGTATLGNAAKSFKGLYLDYTNTATVGAATIDKATGRVNIAAAGVSVVVTNALVTAASHVNAWCSSVDATARVTSTVAAAGSFTINTVATTAQTSFDFVVFGA